LITVKQTTSNIWRLWDAGYYVVIPTNLFVTKGGENVMGAGLARDVKNMFYSAPFWYAFHIHEHISRGGDGRNPHMEDLNLYDLLAVHQEWRLIFFPVKTAWQQQARKGLIKASLDNLALLLAKPLMDGQKVAFPRVGSGNGALDWETDVKPLVRVFLEGLNDDQRSKLTIVHPPEEFDVQHS
jgi:hypothetical protein